MTVEEMEEQIKRLEKVNKSRTTALTVKEKGKLATMEAELTQIMAKLGIDGNALIAKRDEQMLPSIPEQFRDDAKTVLIKAGGVFALTNIGESHQDELIEFEPFECRGCGEVIGPECAYWIALGNMEYMRVKCPECKTLVLPEGCDIERFKRVNRKDPGIRKAMELAGIGETTIEEIVDIEAKEK